MNIKFPGIKIEIRSMKDIKQVYKIEFKTLKDMVKSMTEDQDLREAELLLKDLLAIVLSKKAAKWSAENRI